VEILAPTGEALRTVRTGDAVTFRLHWRADTSVSKPIFGLAIHTLAGVHVTGPNTREAGLVVDAIAGEGTVDLTVGALMLLPGTYDVTVSLMDHAAAHFFDCRQRALRFDVEPGKPHETFGGVVSLGGSWSIDGAASRSGQDSLGRDELQS
jgi:ABC-2 type transport system ATP-binding protein